MFNAICTTHPQLSGLCTYSSHASWILPEVTAWIRDAPASTSSSWVWEQLMTRVTKHDRFLWHQSVNQTTFWHLTITYTGWSARLTPIYSFSSMDSPVSAICPQIQIEDESFRAALVWPQIPSTVQFEWLRLTRNTCSPNQKEPIRFS